MGVLSTAMGLSGALTAKTCPVFLDVHLLSDGSIQGSGIFGISMKVYGQWWLLWTSVEGTRCVTGNGVASWWSEIPLKRSHPNLPRVLKICITKWATSCINIINLSSELTLQQLPQQKQLTKSECWGEKKKHCLGFLVFLFLICSAFVSTRHSLQRQFGALGQGVSVFGWKESRWRLAEPWKSK